MTDNIDTNHSLLLDSRARVEQRSSLVALCERMASLWLLCVPICLDEERIEIIVSHARTYPPVDN